MPCRKLSPGTRALRAVAWCFLTALSFGCSGPQAVPRTVASNAGIDDATRLPTGVHLDPAGSTQPVGPMPLALAAAPDGKHIAVLMNGWAKAGVQIVDWRARRVTQTIELPAAFLGLAFSPDGKWLVASGGNTDCVYRFRWSGTAATLADSVVLAPTKAGRSGTRYPAQLAFSPTGQYLYVLENLADSMAVIDMVSGRISTRLATGRYPYGIVVRTNGDVYVSGWGSDSVTTFAVQEEAVRPKGSMPAGRHPSAMLLNKSGTRLFVASASTDRVTVIDTRTRAVVAVLHDPPPTGPDEGSTPNALALSDDETRLYVAEADANAVAVFDLATGTSAAGAPANGFAPASVSTDSLRGRVPTGWYPAALTLVDGTLIVANGKGGGTHADPDGPGPRDPGKPDGNKGHGTLGQLTGSLSFIDVASLGAEPLRALSARVSRANGWNARTPVRAFPPFEHVVYIIRENRTYDQVLGDVASADGDPSLVYFNRAVTPNAHALVARYGVFDRFFVNAEVSADGHSWSTAAYASDYVEKTVQMNYSSRGRSYDYEGTNRGVIPDDDVNQPAMGYLWNLVVNAGVTMRNYGEYVIERDGAAGSSPMYQATKQALVPVTNAAYPGFDLDIRDQRRADVWLADLAEDVKRGAMPALEIVRLPNDHTSGGTAGKPTPRAYAADNDLALGRMVAALSRTPFWKSTVVFVLEDDAQNGPDHVDSHRSPLLVISPYNRPGTYHRFTNTTDVIRTMEGVLGLGALSHFDYFGRPLHDVFAAEPDVTPYTVIQPSVSLDEKNPRASRGAFESMRLKLDAEDESDDDDFSQILWHVVKGYDVPYPGPTRMSLLEARRGR
jgi:DNA-binding beta-propeller fold protein YncE